MCIRRISRNVPSFSRSYRLWSTHQTPLTVLVLIVHDEPIVVEQECELLLMAVLDHGSAVVADERNGLLFAEPDRLQAAAL